MENLTYGLIEKIDSKPTYLEFIESVTFSEFKDLVKSLNLSIEELVNLGKTYKNNTEVYKITLSALMLEKLDLKNLFYKNGLNDVNNVKYSLTTTERFFKFFSGIYAPFNIEKKVFLMESVIIVKEKLTHDGKINSIYVNKSTYNLILKLLELNNLYGLPQSEKKGLYNVINHVDNNNKHFLLSVENLNLKMLYSKSNLDYNIFERLENFYIDLDSLPTEEKIELYNRLKDFDRKEKIDYINNLTFQNIESVFNDYENYNYKAYYKGLNLKNIRINSNVEKERKEERKKTKYYSEYLEHLKRLLL